MVGSNIRRIRRQRGWTQAFLAQKIGVAQSAVGQIERGEVNPLLSTLFDLAHVLDVEPAALLSESHAAPSQPARS